MKLLPYQQKVIDDINKATVSLGAIQRANVESLTAIGLTTRALKEFSEAARNAHLRV